MTQTPSGSDQQLNFDFNDCAGTWSSVQHLPKLLYVLIPVVILKVLFFRRRAYRPHSGILAGVGVANVISIFLGVPLAWMILLFVEFTVGLTVELISGPIGRTGNSPVWSFLFDLFIAWFTPLPRDWAWVSCVSLALLVIPYFFVSVWLERRIYCRMWRTANPSALSRDVFRINGTLCVLLFSLACGLAIYSFSRSG